LPAFWVGLLYDAGAQSQAAHLVADFTAAEHEYLRTEVPRHALKTEFRGRPLKALAEEVVVARGESPAEIKLANYQDRWKGDVDPIYREYAY
jgi:glutamate--cysteine ligase